MSHKPDNADKPVHADGNSLKETIESIVVAFILAFVFRAFVVEAFVIPTGSMAPTLLGKHVALHCPMCGYDFAADTRDAVVTPNGQSAIPRLIQGRGNGSGNGELSLDCPMCDYPITHPRLRTKPGDRILVLKYVYALSSPRRWDVVVFRNPEQPQVNYIKRLVGLPNESIWIVRGNVYTQPLDPQTGEPTGPWRVQAKPPEDQRAVWQPIYHSRYVPLDAEQRRWRTPWLTRGTGWQVIEDGRAFRYKPTPDAGNDLAADPGGTLRFDFDRRNRFGRDYYPYNEFRSLPLVYVEDLSIGATLDPDDSAGRVDLALRLERIEVEGSIDADGRAELRIRRPEGGPWITVDRGEVRRWTGDRPRRVELWYADQAATLWVEGKAVARFALPMRGDEGVAPDLRPFIVDLDELHEDGPPAVLPAATIGVRGGALTLRNAAVHRDLYYTAENPERAIHRPLDLRDRQYFVLGDNSPASKDSRRLKVVDPWVRHHTRAGHGADGVPAGLVPQKLMVGRAFFVYFPAPYALSPTALPFIPNFGDMRFIE